MSSKFINVPQGVAPIEGFILNQGYDEDSCPQKVNLGMGVYRTEECQPWVLPSVRETDKILIADANINKELLPVLGLESFIESSTKLLLGRDSPAIQEKRVFGVQCLSGSGALRVGAEFLSRVFNCKTFYCSKPTWENHKLIFTSGGCTDGREYRYWSNSTRGLDLEGFLSDLKQAPEGSIIILHACAHNHTGCDPTKEQWKAIADVIEERKLFPFFDSAYQGFATGDVDQDAWAVRYFASRRIEFLCAQSFSKNFGLYNERIGNLVFVVNDSSVVPNVKSQALVIVRGMYSNPPAHGARIVSHILNNQQLYGQWLLELKTMSSRITRARVSLREALEKLGTPGDWSHITSQIGMFTFTGFSEKQCEDLIKNHHIYLMRTGRISMCGITPKNVDYVAKAFHETVLNVK